MTQVRVSCLALLPLFAVAGLTPQDRAIVPLIQRDNPDLKHVAIVQRLQLDDRLDLVLALAKPRPFGDVPGGGQWWGTEDRLGLFLQDRADAGRVYQLAIEPGPNNDCYIKVQRITAQDLILSCTGEKWATYDNQKFVYDVNAKALVKHFSYPPFSVSQILKSPTGPQFVMNDTQQLQLVDLDPETNGLRIVPKAEASATLARIPMEESTAFGNAKRFRLSTEKNKYGSGYPVIVEQRGNKETVHSLPQSDITTWRTARPDDLKSGLRPDQAEMNEQVGPHQLEGNRLWFGKTFYNSEGLTGVGGFGYFDTAARAYHLYSPPEIQRWSVSAILVEPDFIWLALYHRGEYGNSPGGLIRWDRKTEQAVHFKVDAVITQIAHHDDALYLGSAEGIAVLRGDQIQSYFIDRTTDGRYRIVNHS